jgi:AraC-like DNA-binding protein/mannose-6-phosphate isomerase-like protein (cupin superfamily)
VEKKISASMQQHRDDFGIDHRLISAFTRTGLWDHDPAVHLNIHSSHQIIAVISGMILIEDGKEKRSLYRKMAAFIPGGKPHRATTLQESIGVLCHSLFINPALIPWADDRIHLFETSELCQALLKKMNEHNLEDISGGIMGSCLNLFLTLLPSELANHADKIRLPEAKSERNRRIVGFLQANYMNKIRLVHLTRATALSVRQICRCFKAEMRMSVMEYLRLLRLLHASHHLFDQQKKVIDVAYDCGYDSVSTFYQEFKRYFGLSPNQFRDRTVGEPV